jgi:hypothetical protein
MKELVCSTPDDTLENFQERVENAAELIPNNGVMLARVEESFCRLPQACIQNNSGHFEHLL